MWPSTSWLLLARTWPHGLQAEPRKTALYFRLHPLEQDVVFGNLALLECNWFTELSFSPFEGSSVWFCLQFGLFGPDSASCCSCVLLLCSRCKTYKSGVRYPSGARESYRGRGREQASPESHIGGGERGKSWPTGTWTGCQSPSGMSPLPSWPMWLPQ